MRRTTVVAVATLLLVSPATRGAGAPDVASEAVILLERWSTAVRDHRPGRLDDHLKIVTGFTYDDRRILDQPMKMFLSALSGRRYETGTEREQKVYRLAQAARADQGYERFLQRAVILHTDAAIARESEPPTLSNRRGLKSMPDSPLLDTRRMSVNRDGEIRGEIESDWNWPFARSLVGLFHFASPADGFTRDWYHMTTAYMFSRLLYAELTEQLAGAVKLLPDDARFMFHRGAYAEVQSLPINQVLLRGVDLYAIRLLRQGRRLPAQTSAATRAAAALDLPFKHEALEEAERHFRLALKADPRLIEARVRLGRVLIEGERYEEALGELRLALDTGPTGDVAFYAHLFSGRAARALGRLDDAGRHFDEALRLFPAAQSALLARSQLALLRADVTAAVAPLQRLPKDPAPEDMKNDPWASYRLGIGREWEALYASLIERK